MVEILQFVHEISSSLEVFYKRGVLNNFSKFTAKHKKQSFEGILSKDRSSHRKCSIKKGVLKNFANFTGKHLSQSFIFNKFAGQSLFTKHLQTTASERIFSKIFAKVTEKHYCWGLFLKLQF